MKKAQIVEVGPRDGLQNDKVDLGIPFRADFIRKLVDAGINKIEGGAFVSPAKVPMMAGSDELFKALGPLPKGVSISALVPNERGMEDALKVGVKEVAVFAAASETFSLKNINCSIEESFLRFDPVFKLARKNKIKVRGYISMVFGCPYEGHVSEKKVLEVAKRLLKLGVYEISFGDTIGVATPIQVASLIRKLKRFMPHKKIAMHFHDTRGTALANIAESVRFGVGTFDSSLGGLGGCPYAEGATGNVATEDVVYLLEGMGIKTGVDLQALLEVNQWVSNHLKRPLNSRVSRAGTIPDYII